MINDFLEQQKNNKIKTVLKTEQQLKLEIMNNRSLKQTILRLEAQLKNEENNKKIIEQMERERLTFITKIDELTNNITDCELYDNLNTIRELKIDKENMAMENEKLIKKVHNIEDTLNKNRIIINNQQTKIIDLDQRNVELNQKNVELNQRNVELNQRNVELNQINVKLNQKNVELNQINVELNQRNVDLNQKNVDLNQKNVDLNQKNVDLNQKNVDLNQIIEECNKEINVKNQMTNELKNANKELVSKLETHIINESNLNKQLDDLKSRLEKALNNNNLLVKEIDFLKKDTKIINNNIGSMPTIYMVYQYNYVNDKVTGLGDFIRGCFYWLQFAEKYCLNVDFMINDHPLKKFLKYFVNNANIDKKISKNIHFFRKPNYAYYTDKGLIKYNYKDIDYDLFKFIETTTKYDENKYLYLISHPDESYINQNHKKRLREIIEPTYEINLLVEDVLQRLQLEKRNFNVIHLRLHDDHFYNKMTPIGRENINNIINKIKNITEKCNMPIFLLSSNNAIKNILTNNFPDIKILTNSITHIADPRLCNDENTKNTLVEFYLMSHAKNIISFSVYEHGSGFSKWCACAYNIPYACFKLSTSDFKSFMA
jgi:hypothetical protein